MKNNTKHIIPAVGSSKSAALHRCLQIVTIALTMTLIAVAPARATVLIGTGLTGEKNMVTFGNYKLYGNQVSGTGPDANGFSYGVGAEGSTPHVSITWGGANVGATSSADPWEYNGANFYKGINTAGTGAAFEGNNGGNRTTIFTLTAAPGYNLVLNSMDFGLVSGSDFGGVDISDGTGTLGLGNILYHNVGFAINSGVGATTINFGAITAPTIQITVFGRIGPDGVLGSWISSTGVYNSGDSNQFQPGKTVGYGNINFGEIAVPEPQTWVMLFSGVGMLTLMRRRSKR